MVCTYLPFFHLDAEILVSNTNWGGVLHSQLGCAFLNWGHMPACMPTLATSSGAEITFTGWLCWLWLRPRLGRRFHILSQLLCWGTTCLGHSGWILKDGKQCSCFTLGGNDWPQTPSSIRSSRWGKLRFHPFWRWGNDAEAQGCSWDVLFCHIKGEIRLTLAPSRIKKNRERLRLPFIAMDSS